MVTVIDSVEEAEKWRFSAYINSGLNSFRGGSLQNVWHHRNDLHPRFACDIGLHLDRALFQNSTSHFLAGASCSYLSFRGRPYGNLQFFRDSVLFSLEGFERFHAMAVGLSAAYEVDARNNSIGLRAGFKLGYVFNHRQYDVVDKLRPVVAFSELSPYWKPSHSRWIDRIFFSFSHNAIRPTRSRVPRHVIMLMAGASLRLGH
ncbi:MAG: hypothetical protein RLP15_02785 [Cryomorphaceae bacterium]